LLLLPLFECGIETVRDGASFDSDEERARFVVGC
jgi:hypothetical protein